MLTTIISLLGIVIAWNIIYRVIKGRTPLRRKVKTTLVVLLFSSLILRFSHDIYAGLSRAIFSFNKQGEIELINSPLRVPPNQDATYCHQFKNQHGQVIDVVSTRGDGKYCGEFWQFKDKKSLLIPYKLNANQTIYWVSPSLQIVGPKLP
ncbi:Uncharacterised protein [Legionella beliardensis]|uniref:Uncharacterized protein n=1 Tax=Legionella beliardensis TaxID=91822 RepID=A0A378I3I3_9GAMM|nr:hypothetical protein [Legionella beliardensis]STX29422.1 Uncharacterised protein [Legionella beliardensis]